MNRKRILRLLFVTSEAYPLIKTGGLADVSGALPIAIKNLDPSYDIRILIPGYTPVLTGLESITPIAELIVLGQVCTLMLGTLPSQHSSRALEVIVIKNSQLYERTGGPYCDDAGNEWADNALRFGILSRVASLLSSSQTPLTNWIPELAHCNDWQTGLAPAYMKLVDHSSAKSIFSIHNMAFQGNFRADMLASLELPIEHFTMDGFEFYGQLSFLKAGIFYADHISTVSPTYAQEIQTSAYGCGLEGLLQLRQAKLTGILNGIDIHDWHPAHDKHLPANYSNKNIANKKRIKKQLQQQLQLEIDANAPLLGVVSRLTSQKGLDLLPEIVPKLITEGCQLVILGSGDKTLEYRFKQLALRYPNQVSVTIGYNEPLSHNIMAGCDLFIMPSRFEPCGLNQLYALAYGTPPIVSATGGLADSVNDTNAQSILLHTATGFVLENVTAAALLVTIMQALTVYQHKKLWRKIQSNGMKQEVNWTSSAKLYLELYKKTLAG